MKKLALYLVVGVALLGCGDNDSDSDSDSNLDFNLLSGFYEGTTNEGEYLEGLVDDDNKLWFIYSEDDDFLGFIRSDESIVLNNGEFVSLGKNYSFDSRDPRDITINGNYKTSKTLKGTVSELSAETITYNAGYDEVLSARKQTLDMINNQTYNGVSHMTGDMSSSTTTVKFTTDGNFTIDDSESCVIAGKFTPSVSGRYFVSTVTFSGTSCTEAGDSYTGIALLDSDNELIFLGTDAMKNKSLAFVS